MTVSVGGFHLTASEAVHAPDALIPKDLGHSPIIRRRGPTIVCSGAFPNRPTEKVSENWCATRAPNARERRAARAKQERHQRQRDTFSDLAAFAYFRGWSLDMRITVSWDVCLRQGDHAEGHVLLEPDKERNEELRDALWRRLRKDRKSFACIWARDTGGQYGHYNHIALYWPLPVGGLVRLLVRVTGS